MRRRLPGRGEPDRLAIDLDPAAVIGMDATQDLHQGGLAGAVLAHQGMDFSAPDRQADITQYGDATELLGDACHGHGIRRGMPAHRARLWYVLAKRRRMGMFPPLLLPTQAPAVFCRSS